MTSLCDMSATGLAFTLGLASACGGQTGPSPTSTGGATSGSATSMSGAASSGFVNQISSEDPLMKVVNPGDPWTSFLWYKMNDRQNMFDRDCQHGDFGTCGPQMPNDGPLLPQDQRNLICSWIAQGAPDN